MSKRLYDFLKAFALVWLPGAGAMYFGLAEIWGLPAGPQVVGTIAVIDTFLGILVKKTSSDFQKATEENSELKGDFVVQQNIDGDVVGMRFEANNEMLVLPDQKIVSFYVRRETI